MATKVGTLIREARTAAKLTQDQLSRLIDGLSASDISRAERGEIELSQSMLKQIAKATGVTQASLLNAAKEDSAASAKTAATKTTSSKTTATKSTATKSTSAKASSDGSVKVTAAEKKLLDAYRAATADQKKAALSVLKGECNDKIISFLAGGNSMADTVADLLTGSLGKLFDIK